MMMKASWATPRSSCIFLIQSQTYRHVEVQFCYGEYVWKVYAPWLLAQTRRFLRKLTPRGTSCCECSGLRALESDPVLVEDK